MEDLRKKYQTDADLIGSKQRFGFFSIPPSHTAGKTDFSITACHKNNDGRVVTENRNIYSGCISTGILNKNYFSVPQSIYHGDPYDKSKTNDNIRPKTSKIGSGDQEVFKPAMLNKTLCTPAYSYACENPPPRNPKSFRNEDGSVKTKERNICANSMSKIGNDRNKGFLYSSSPYDAERIKRNKERTESMKLLQKENPFRSGGPGLKNFSSNIQTFNDNQIKEQKKKSQTLTKTVAHESAFKPNCKSKTDDFSYPEHRTDFPPNQLKKTSYKKGEAFRLPIKPYSSKPCPSISCSMMNLRSKIR